MKKWIFSALLYLLIVIAGYSAYTSFIAADEEKIASKKTEQDVENGHEIMDDASHGDGHDMAVENDDRLKGNQGTKQSEVKVDFIYKDSRMEINLADQSGKAVKDLEVNHEKLLHLIVVDEHLGQYYHLHPEKIGDGKFEVKKELEEGNYKAFVDIKLKEQKYEVSPIEFAVGNPGSEHGHTDGLKVDFERKQSIEGETAVLKMDSLSAGKTATLTFEVNESNLEPYLGAMGHVVILDEKAEEYLHVHPADDDQPIFETNFPESGLYKIWAEFKQGGKVRAFPFVVEIK